MGYRRTGADVARATAAAEMRSAAGSMAAAAEMRPATGSTAAATAARMPAATGSMPATAAACSGMPTAAFGRGGRVGRG